MRLRKRKGKHAKAVAINNKVRVSILVSVDDLLISLFGGAPGLYNLTMSLWLGIGIRHWTHVVEFGMLGLFVALVAMPALRPCFLRPVRFLPRYPRRFSLFD